MFGVRLLDCSSLAEGFTGVARPLAPSTILGTLSHPSLPPPAGRAILMSCLRGALKSCPFQSARCDGREITCAAPVAYPFFSSSLLCRPSYVEAELMTQICTRCENTYWVCERHLDQPWSDVLPNGCECGAGVPCPDCRPRASRSIRRIRGSAPAAAPPTDVAKRPRRTRSIATASVQPLAMSRALKSTSGLVSTPQYGSRKGRKGSHCRTMGARNKAPTATAGELDAHTSPSASQTSEKVRARANDQS